MRTVIVLALAAVAGAAAQSPAFDVSSVKRAPQHVGRGITVEPGGRFMAPSATVLVGDPGRDHLPSGQLIRVAGYDTAGAFTFSDAQVRHVEVYRLAA